LTVSEQQQNKKLNIYPHIFFKIRNSSSAFGELNGEESLVGSNFKGTFVFAFFGGAFS
jgi:hypothetical protein